MRADTVRRSSAMPAGYWPIRADAAQTYEVSPSTHYAPARCFACRGFIVAASCFQICPPSPADAAPDPSPDARYAVFALPCQLPTYHVIFTVEEMRYGAWQMA